MNGVLVTTPAFFVTGEDHITVGGYEILQEMEKARLFKYHKPCGLLVTHRDPKERRTIFEELPAGLPRLISVGRLDLNSEGLLLLTNNGVLSRTLEHPRTSLKRTYRVRVWGHVCEEQLDTLRQGIVVDGVPYGPIEARLDAQKKSNAWLTLSLWEGKNREIRRVMAHLGLTVNKLIRLSYGPFELGSLALRDIQEIPEREFSLFLSKSFA